MRQIINNSKVQIIDNSGVYRIRCIQIYRNRSGQPGDLYVGSLQRVKPRRRLKSGQIFRAVFVQSRYGVFREFGHYLRSLATRSIVIRKGDIAPLANRMNGYYFKELKEFVHFKFSVLTVYSI